MGVWEGYYQKGSGGAPTSPVGYACTAIKRELRFNSFGDGLNLSKPSLGDAFDARCRDFQKHEGIGVDGVVGPETMKALLRLRVGMLTATYQLPGAVMGQIAYQESSLDPGAVGSNPADKGLVQINRDAHPEISDQQAFSPAFAFEYLARTLRMVRATTDIDTAIAAWHVGVGGAQAWYNASKPDTGGPSWSPSLYAEATKYVAAVRGRSW